MSNNTTDCGPELWEAIADDWDERIGVDGNDFHRELIRPATMRFLDPQPGVGKPPAADSAAGAESLKYLKQR